MKITIIIFFVAIINFMLSPVFALDSTPSADIADKLKEFQKEAASKAAQMKELIAKRLQNKAFIGNIESLSASSLTLSAKSGPRMVSINQDTVFEKSAQRNLSSGIYIAALGDADETGVLTAKKIVLLKNTEEKPKTYLWGQIIAVSGELVTLRSRDFKNVAVSMPKSSKVKLNDSVILTGSFTKDIFESGFVYVFPQNSIFKPKNTATPSAKEASAANKIKSISR